MQNERYLSSEVDYLGVLGAKLRDLRGSVVLASELIQNADDAQGATSISLDIRDDALVVENDGIFQACDDPDAPGCTWEDDQSIGHKCDFHRFRRIASGDKRRQLDTAGAFGIGFIAVYQVTDKPEMESAGQRYVLDPTAESHQRIRRSTSALKSATRFRLPWAFDPESKVRRALRAQAVTNTAIDMLFNDLQQALPRAILFLRKLTRITLLRNGKVSSAVSREIAGSQVTVYLNGMPTQYRVFRGTFSELAVDLRASNPNLIEIKKSADIAVAMPVSGTFLDGRLYAYLPTDTLSGLPIHIQADFYPTNDRKNILFNSGDYQEEWNAAAIESAAELIASNLITFRDLVPPEEFWRLLEALHKLNEPASRVKYPACFQTFWTRTRAALPDLPIIWTCGKSWEEPKSVFILTSPSEHSAAGALQATGLKIVDDTLRPFWSILRGPDLAVRALTAQSLANHIIGLPLIEPISIDDAPSWLRDDTLRGLLESEIATLLDRCTKDERPAAEKATAACAIVRSDANTFVPPCKLLRVKDDEREMLAPFGVPHLLAAATAPEALQLLCKPITVAVLVAMLAGRTKEQFEHLWRTANHQMYAIISWCQRSIDLDGLSIPNITGLKALPMWPAGDCLLPLSELVMPGGFVDPLGLSKVLDADICERYLRLLGKLNVTRLTFADYIRHYVVKRSQQGPPLSGDACRSLLRLLSHNLKEVADDEDIREAASSLAIVECADGRHRAAVHTYFDSPVVRGVLGDGAPYVANGYSEAVRLLLKELGTRNVPELSDVFERVKGIVSRPPNTISLAAIAAIVGHLATLHTSRNPEMLTYLGEFSRLAWLPVEGNANRWFIPREVAAVFRKYLFETQAHFLALDQKTQQESANLLRDLGVIITPSVPQVVAHVKKCSGSQRPVNPQVYDFLNEHRHEAAVSTLSGIACLMLSDGRYVRPDEVFWNPGPLVGYRFRLSSDLRRLTELFEVLGVREQPTWEDARKVLLELAHNFQQDKHALSEQLLGVVYECWRMLQSELDDPNQVSSDEILSPLKEVPVIPDNKGLLYLPGWLYLEDRPGLKDHFARAQSMVIPMQEGAWRAMHEVGVRFLSECVISKIVRGDQTIVMDFMTGVLHDRTPAVRRVLERIAPTAIGTWMQVVLQAIRFIGTSGLQIVHELDFHGSPIKSLPVEIQAHCDLESMECFVMMEGEAKVRSWVAVAREIAMVLQRSADPSQLASPLSQVLQSGDLVSAQRLLDELGFPRLAETIRTQASVAEVSIGSGADAESAFPETLTEPQPSAPETNELSGQLGTNPNRPQSTSGREDDDLDSGSASTASDPEPDLQNRDEDETDSDGEDEDNDGEPGPFAFPAGGRTGSKGGTGDGRQKGIPHATPTNANSPTRKFVSYVSVDPKNEEGPDPDGLSQQARMDLEEKAIQLILNRDGSLQRTPTHNRGFDLFEPDEDGDPIRWVEVKAMTGPFEARPVCLSRPQFDCSVANGEAYWLYVVEFAGDARRARILCIQDPYGKTKYFTFDHGWVAVAVPG